MTLPLIAAAVLLTRNRYYAELRRVEEADEDRDGIPDVYQREAGDESR